MVHDNRNGLREELQLPLKPRQLGSQGDGCDRSFIAPKQYAKRFQLPQNVGEALSGIRERRILAVHCAEWCRGHAVRDIVSDTYRFTDERRVPPSGWMAVGAPN